MAGFSTAVTGLKASTTMLDVAGNNIANASTTGFKSSRTEFGDIYATAVVGAGSSNTPGSGVTVTDIAQDFSAGTIEFTNNNLDLAINGSGFFQLNDGQGGVTYTRAGAFELDKEGYIVSKNGKYLQGYGLDEQGNRLPIGNMAVMEKESPPKPTENINLSFNIDAREDASKLLPVYNKDEPGSFTWTTTDRTFDSLGNEHTIKYNFVEQRPVRQVLQYDVSATGPYTISDVTVTFDATGQLNPASKTALGSADKRIDLDTVTLDTTGTQNTLRFELNAWATDSGDVVVKDGNVTLAQTNTATEDRYRDANEVRVYEFDATTATGTVVIAGEEIQVSPADANAINLSDLIATHEARILERNPAIESVTATVSPTNPSNNVQLSIRYKAEEGNIPDSPDPYPVVLPSDPTSPIQPDSTSQGDNSFMGYYRMYAYLNNEELLDIGKAQDPGEGSLTEPGPILIRFNPTNGLLREINGQTFTANAQVPAITIKGADPAYDLTKISLDLTGATQFASSSIVKASQQDGYTKGDLIGVTFSGAGEMIASFSNGQNQALGVVALATFENQAGLQPSGDTEWIATLDSGDAIVNPPGTGLNGTLRSAALEASNVDLSEELVKLIEGQRNYQANSKTLETMNAITQTILQI
jgi:flagellar hook protein FlgE